MQRSILGAVLALWPRPEAVAWIAMIDLTSWCCELEQMGWRLGCRLTIANEPSLKINRNVGAEEIVKLEVLLNLVLLNLILLNLILLSL